MLFQKLDFFEKQTHVEVARENQFVTDNDLKYDTTGIKTLIYACRAADEPKSNKPCQK